MLIKEYRIPLPLTVEEYRIAQLYMIAKKSREESQGEGSGVEIIVNEPYNEGPGGKGQYTRKIYHVGSHLPGWIKSLLPKSALTVEEEAWNAYPYTKTRYTCPFVEKFSLEIETCYKPDNGYQENVFDLGKDDLKNRVVDLIDIVRDPVTGADYCREEDPCLYVSEKTKRGPLTEDWIDTYWNEVKGKKQPTSKNMSLMCAYKLCRVEFRYWGMQTKLEKFIHDIALRKTMVKAHRQAWAWQDEWCGLTMDDIREIERQTQLALQKKMGRESEEANNDESNLSINTENESKDQKEQSIASQEEISHFHSNKKRESLDLNSYSLSEEEFFDCLGEVTDNISLGKWESIEPLEDLEHDNLHLHRQSSQLLHPDRTDYASCAVQNLLIVFHGGSVLDVGEDLVAKRSDITTFKGVMEFVIRQHYTSMIGRVAIKKVSCENICTDILSKLSSINPYSFEATYAEGPLLPDTLIGSIPLIATLKPNYEDIVIQSIQAANKIYQDFIKSNEGFGFRGDISIIGDSVGSIIAYDALRMTAKAGGNQFLFDVTNVFTFGSPLGMILSARMFQKGDFKRETLPCQQFYNLFHSTDPLSCRIESIMNRKMANISPVNIPRYSKYPKGHGHSFDLAHFIHLHPHTFMEHNVERRSSDASSQSKTSGAADMIACKIQQNWWGTKRIDYALYCPEGLSNLAVSALPHLFHSSYWESCDAVAFILRQIGKFDNVENEMSHNEMKLSDHPREKWIRKRTSVKLKNVASNHRANDVIVKEGEPQKLTARFMYGPLDMITLAGEKVDIYIMKENPDWTMMSTEVTDKNGRIFYTIPSDKTFGFGVYPVKMIVRGDQTSVEFLLAVVPPHTECVVFSIDGSFTASMSVSGKDPKVRPGAVDICRYWQDLGYLLIYITGRPDMQQQKVMSWLSQHNFPYGLLSFADGLSADPLGHKRAHLIDLIESHDIIISYAYGSNKDIAVYNSIGLQANQVFTVGKVNKKLQACTTVISDGYVAHLSQLKATAHRPVHGNARMVIPRDLFRFPEPSASIRKQR